MLRLRRRISGFLTISALAVIAALAATTFGFSPAQAHTTTAVLFPNGQGNYTAWTNTESAIDETGAPDCGSGDSVISSTANARESVLIDLASIPNGATITSVDVQAWHRGDSTAGGTFQTFARLDGTDTDSGTNITTGAASGGCQGPATQAINVADTVKAAGTALEIGVLKTGTTGVRVGALRATVTYNTGPSAPTLTSPADAATTQDRTPTFDWDDDSVDPNDLTSGSTAVLIPTSNGFYIDWGGEVDRIDETGTPSCSSSDYLDADTTGRRDSFVIPLASIPNGVTITTVDVQAFHRGDGTAGGTFQTFTRLNGTDTDSGTNIAAVGTADGPCTAATQTINVADTVKSGATTLEIGVLKTAANTNKVRMGALRAVVNYTAPPSTEGPFTYEIGRAAFVSGACDWDNDTIDAVSSSTFTPSSTMSFGVHCWRVRALDHAGLAGPWSTHRTLTIEQTDVTAEITAADKEYDGTTDAEYTCEVVGAEAGDDVTCDGDHPASFDSAGAGTGKTVTATGLALSGADAGNYNLTNTTDTDTADITKATLSVDADDKSKDYGDADPTLTYTLNGFVNGEDALTAGITGAGECSRAAGETVAGSPYVITCTSGTLAADNYTFANGETGELTINKADPNCTVTGFSGTYDGNPHGATGSCAGVNGEGPLAGLDLGDSFTNVPGGTANWTFTDQTGNYTDDSGSVQIDITAATLSVDADDKSKDFGDPDPTFTYTLSGFVNGEDEDSAGVTGDADCTRAAGESVAGSPYTITCTPGTLDAANYTFQTGDTGELTIEAGDVTAEITASDKEYDGTTDAEYTCEVVGEQAGDDVTCDGTHPGTFDDANAGTGKTVTATGLTLGGADAGNYTLTNSTDTDQADITKVTLSVDADDKSKNYGDADPTLTYTLTGFVAGEDAMTAAITGAGDCTRDSGESVAGSPYAITCTPGTLAADNYDFETGETGELTINTATLSVDADDKTKDFGDPDPTFTYTLSGFVNGEDDDSAGVTGDADCSRESGESVGTYTITCAPGTLDAANYTFQTGDTGILTIEAADVTAEITAADKEYDGTTDAQYTCEVVGEQSGDDVTCDGTHPGTFDNANAGTGKTVTATGLTLGGADAGSYTLTNTTDTDQADITKKTLSVDADDKSKEFGDADPTFTYSLTGFVAGEDALTAGITGAASCSRESGESVGTYTITCAPGTLDADNYTFQTGDTGTLTINPDTSVPSVTINQASGQDDPTSASPIEFDVVFSEPVTGFEDSDVDLSGTAGATTASVSGSGAEYTVSVSGMTDSGTVIASIPAGAATDGTNNSAASTSTDNTVTFDDSVGSLPPKHLDMETKSSTYAGNRITVEIEKLAPGEAYTIKIDGEVVKTGTANSKGKVETRVTVPLSLQPGTYKIQAIGSQPNRQDTDDLRVKTPSDLDVELRRSSVTAGGTQRVSVDDLLRGEKVEVRYDGNLISPSDAKGDSDGEYELSFPVGTTVGTHTVEVTGTYDGRSTTKTFKVVIDDDDD